MESFGRSKAGAIGPARVKRSVRSGFDGAGPAQYNATGLQAYRPASGYRRNLISVLENGCKGVQTCRRTDMRWLISVSEWAGCERWRAFDAQASRRGEIPSVPGSVERLQPRWVCWEVSRCEALDEGNTRPAVTLTAVYPYNRAASEANNITSWQVHSMTSISPYNSTYELPYDITIS